MKSTEFIIEGWSFRNKNRIYSLLVDTINSGPFDGGCVVFARALQIKYGRGEIVVLVNRDDRAEHAALQVGNTLVDADGQLPINEFIRRFRRLERVWIDDVRPIHPNDLPDAPRNEELANQISELL